MLRSTAAYASQAAEKERVAAWPVQGETILDMYAGAPAGRVAIEGDGRGGGRKKIKAMRPPPWPAQSETAIRMFRWHFSHVMDLS